VTAADFTLLDGVYAAALGLFLGAWLHLRLTHTRMHIAFAAIPLFAVATLIILSLALILPANPDIPTAIGNYDGWMYVWLCAFLPGMAVGAIASHRHLRRYMTSVFPQGVRK